MSPNLFQNDIASLNKVSCMDTWVAKVGVEEPELLAWSPDLKPQKTIGINCNARY